MFQIGSDHLEGGWVLFLRVGHEAFWSQKSLLFDNQIDNPYNFIKQYGI